MFFLKEIPLSSFIYNLICTELPTLIRPNELSKHEGEISPTRTPADIPCATRDFLSARSHPPTNTFQHQRTKERSHAPGTEEPRVLKTRETLAVPD